MSRSYLLAVLILLFSSRVCHAASRYDKPSPYPFGVYGGVGIGYPISGKNKIGDEINFKMTFPPEFGFFGGYKVNKFLELRSYLYWNMISLKVNSSQHAFLLMWKKHNISLDLNLNVYLHQNIHQYYLVFGFDVYTTLSYKYKAENSNNIPSDYKISTGLGGIDSVDSLYEEEEKPTRIGGGINIGSGFIFDSGLVIESYVNIDFSTFNILSATNLSSENKGPEAELFNQMVNAFGTPFFKLRIGYDLSNLIP